MNAESEIFEEEEMINIEREALWGEPAKIESEGNTFRAIDIARKIRSFDHFLFIWGERGGYYMPPKSVLTWKYIAQILSKEKKLLKASEVGAIVELPKAKGLLVESLFTELKNEKEFGKYFPDDAERRAIPRTYFFNLVSSDHENHSSSKVQYHCLGTQQAS